MKFRICKNNSGFFPQIIRGDNSRMGSDEQFAEYLHLNYEEYIDFIIENKGFLSGEYYFFKTEKHCQEFIENFLEPRLILQELIK